MGCSIVGRLRRVAVSIAFWVACCLPVAATAADAAQRISFNRDIRPILSENCFACHGPDGGNRQAGLRLDVAEQATAELESGARAIVPENIEASELIARVISDDPDSLMPPPEAKIGRLDVEQVEILKQWIAQGARYEPHWAFVPVAKPELPPAGQGADVLQGMHPIDRIVRSRLSNRGISPQPEADKPTLIRRVTFDITGLPPTPAEVSAFVADTSPEAYEKLLERLLASPGMESGWRPTGWIWPATPTATDFRSTASGRCGPGATG